MRWLGVFLTGFVLMSCSQKGPLNFDGEDLDLNKPSYNMTNALHSTLSVVSGVMDEHQGESMARVKEFRLFPVAWAATCDRAAASPCDGGERTASYTGCSIPGTDLSLSGQVTLTYSDAACTLTNSGDRVVRTFSDLKRDAVIGGKVEVLSNSRGNYLGENIGGGASLTKTDAGWDLSVSGAHRVHLDNLFDVSVRTTEDIQVTRGLGRGDRVLDGGSIEVFHNKLGYKSTLTLDNLTFDADCCYPVGGVITSEQEGFFSGQTTATFSGCGEVSVERNDLTVDVTLTHCF